MTPTPRSDAFEHRIINGTGTYSEDVGDVCTFARQLETDLALATDVILRCNAWIAEAKPLLEKGGEAERELSTLRTRLAAAEEDGRRLDWLQVNACEEGRTMAMPRYSYRVAQWNGQPGRNIRAAIDAARFPHTEGNP